MNLELAEQERTLARAGHVYSAGPRNAESKLDRIVEFLLPSPRAGGLRQLIGSLRRPDTEPDLSYPGRVD